MRVDHDQEISRVAQAESHEALFPRGERVFSRESEVIGENGGGFGKADSVRLEIRCRLGRVPLVSHLASV